ncbi:hypothetical protein ACIQC9_07040 [Brevundimonas sp. NPDC092305]|uniref:hypothetical protein n=1 Tax=Brevundimonas sp. NPDC092305 TaxID=3363957 RepID=UPI003811847E
MVAGILQSRPSTIDRRLVRSRAIRLRLETSMVCRRTFLSAAGASAVIPIAPPSSAHSGGAGSLKLRFVSNSLADYLHLLFFRAAKPRLPAFTAPGFETAPTLDSLVAVPELVAAAGLREYRELAPFVSETFAALPQARILCPKPLILSYRASPPTLSDVLAVISAGEPWYEAFGTYWQAGVKPVVEAQIAAWRRQNDAGRPLDGLLRMHRLPLRADGLVLAAMPFHPAGSANYTPAGVYTGLFRTPDLGRVLGHEASHLLWSKAVGTDWKSHPLAPSVRARFEPADVDVEETMCLLVQTRLSQDIGVQPSDYRVSSDLEAGLQRDLMIALERDWTDYLSDAGRWPNLIDYVLDTASTLT